MCSSDLGIFIFDFSGKKVKSVEIKDASGINEYGERVHNGNRVIEIIYDESEVLKYVLPTKFKRRDVKYSVTNGILEVIVKK